LVVLVSTTFLVTMSLWLLYRRNPLTRTRIELRQARRRAASGVSRATREISQVKKEMARVERTEQRVANQHAKKRASLQADFDRRRGAAFDEIESIDQRLAQLGGRRQHEIGRSLKKFQQNYVRTRLSQAVLDANDVPGVGAQLVANLRSIGIRSAADFAGIGYIRNGRSVTVYFHLASGGRMHVPGIGEVKARRIEQWRQAQVANVVRLQPSALPPSELQAIDAQFAAAERQLKKEHARLAGQIADKIAAIQRELDAALADADSQHNTELITFAQRKAELSAKVGQAHSGHLAAEQQLLDCDNRLAAAWQPAFSRFVSAAIRG
jgi:phage host-nuclease inhibitor protein Gam